MNYNLIQFLNKQIRFSFDIYKMSEHYEHEHYEHEHYDMITDQVAIGNHLSPYEPFDIIVNLCFPENKVKHRQIVKTFLTQKTIICVGINDRKEENMISLLMNIIPTLVKMYHHNNHNVRILFHCYAGISRSSSVAIAYLMIIHNLSLHKALELVKSKRQIVNPNPGFLNALQQFEQKINS